MVVKGGRRHAELASKRGSLSWYFQKVGIHLFSRTIASSIILNRELWWHVVRSRVVADDAVGCLKKLLPTHTAVTKAIVEDLFEELIKNNLIKSSLDFYADRYPDIFGNVFRSSLAGSVSGEVLFCYILNRLLKPEVVVETGCFTGWTSTLFLAALIENRKGHLHSIDIPIRSPQPTMRLTLPEELPPGYLVPKEFRGRWNLILGNTRLELIPLLEKIGPIDVFFHDSEHSYQHMMWEYTSAWSYLKEGGGVLISDDIHWNSALWDFSTAMEKSVGAYSKATSIGFVRK